MVGKSSHAYMQDFSLTSPLPNVTVIEHISEGRVAAIDDCISQMQSSTGCLQWPLAQRHRSSADERAEPAG